MLQVHQHNSKTERDADIPTGSRWGGTGFILIPDWILNLFIVKTFILVDLKKKQHYKKASDVKKKKKKQIELDSFFSVCG